jgi:hypothetical protein
LFSSQSISKLLLRNKDEVMKHTLTFKFKKLKSNKTFWILFGSSLLISLCGVYLTRNYLMDDALITLRYSFNFAKFGIPIWNQADLRNPSMGYTSLLWMSLNALPALITSNKDILVLTAQLFSLAALVLIIGVICKEIASLTLSTPLKVITALMIFTQFGYGLHVNSAMETMLFSLFMLLTVRAYGKGHYLQAYIFSALGFLTRPEGAILCGLVFLADLVNGQFKRAAAAGAGFIILLGGLFALLNNWYGDFLPNTFYAKQEFFNTLALKRTLFFIITIALPYLIMSTHTAFSLKKRTSLYMLLVSIIFIVYYLSVDPIMNVMSRYQWPTLVLLTFASIPTIEYITQNSVKYRKVIIILVLVVIGLNTGNAMGVSYFSSATGHAEQNIILIGKTMSKYRQPEKWLVYHDAGAVCYFSDWNTHETIGLTNGQLARKQITLDDIFENPDSTIAMQNFDLSGEWQYEAQKSYTEKLSKYGFQHIQDIPVLYVEGQRNFVVSMYSRDINLARTILSDLIIEEALKPNFTYNIYQIAKELFGR